MEELLRVLREAVTKAELAQQDYQAKSAVYDQKISIFEERLMLVMAVEEENRLKSTDLERRESEVRRNEHLVESEIKLDNDRLSLQRQKEDFEKWKTAEERRLKDTEDQLTVRRNKLDEVMKNDIVRRHLQGIQ